MSQPPRLIVFSGAGLSAESGLPTFRGENGLWDGVPLRQVCHIETWRENFEAMHDFYDERRLAEARAQPNDAHRAIAEWQQRWPDRVDILTQNIDTLLERAGASEVVHLHGGIRELRCFACAARWEIEAQPYDRKGCPACGDRSVKPGVVFFGEPAPRYQDLFQTVRQLRTIDTAIVVGTSGAVLPADQLFGHSPAFSILVNLEPASQMDESTFCERHYGPATRELPALTAKVRERMG